MKNSYQILFFILFTPMLLFSQGGKYSIHTAWEVNGLGMAMTGGVYDLNRDGYMDIIVGNYFDTEVYYFNTDSTLPNYEPGLTYEGRMLAILDFNGDGHEDMISLNLTEFDSTGWHSRHGEMLYYFGSDTGAPAIDTIVDYRRDLPVYWPETFQFSWGYLTQGVKTGDLNGDGKEDLIVNSYRYDPSSSTLRDYGRLDILMGRKVPIDSSDYYAVGGWEVAVFGHFFDVGDVNGDGYDDLFASERFRPWIPHSGPKDSLEMLRVWWGKPDFTFTYDNYDEYYVSWVKRYVAPEEKRKDWFTYRFSLADVNDDGYSDIVCGGLGYEIDTTTVYYGSSTGFDTIPDLYLWDFDSTDTRTFSGTILKEVGDFNGDGWDDLVMPGGSVFELILGGPYCGNQNPYGLRGHRDANPFFPNRAFSAGDYDGDGDEELVIFNRSTLNVWGNAIVMLGNNGVHVGVEDESNVEIPDGFYLYQNYPNPFNGQTEVKYFLPETSAVTFTLYDSNGSEVRVMDIGNREPGEHTLHIDAEELNLSSGVYFLKMNTDKFHETIKLVYLK